MTEAMLVSNAVLWVVVIALTLVVLALARQVGILHEPVAPAGALMPTSGPKVGESTETMSLTDLNGNAVSIDGVNSNDMHTLVLFISPLALFASHWCLQPNRWRTQNRTDYN